MPDRRGLPVWADVGIEPARDDCEAAALVATYAPLARRAERRAARPPTPAATPGTCLPITEYTVPDTDEGRTGFGNAFVGTVTRVISREAGGLSPDRTTFVVPTITYEVDVERTLRGDVPTGNIVVSYAGFDPCDPDSSEAPTLKVGDRALFFSGNNSLGLGYPVDAQIGIVLVRDDHALANAVATYTPLIRAAEAATTAKAARSANSPRTDPCETPPGPAALAAEPARVAAGDDVRLVGGPFVRPEVAVAWDGAVPLERTVPVGTDCGVDAVVAVPKVAPGSYEVVVHDALGREATTALDVVAP